MRKLLKTLTKTLKPVLAHLPDPLRQAAVNFYLFLSSLERWVINYVRRRRYPAVPILLYHRIAKLADDPVKLAVSPETFEKHLLLLAEKYEVISLAELVSRLDNGTLNGKELCLTFDDGYLDNLTSALPILEKYRLPAAIFVTTYRLGELSAFAFDAKYRQGERASFLSADQIYDLSLNPLIEIGAHTHTHPRLSSLSPAGQRAEIRSSKEILEKITGKKIRFFAYPFGERDDYSDQTKSIAQELGFAAALENTGLLAIPRSDRYSLPRINIRECSNRSLLRLIHGR